MTRPSPALRFRLFVRYFALTGALATLVVGEFYGCWLMSYGTTVALNLAGYALALIGLAVPAFMVVRAAGRLSQNDEERKL